MSTIQPAFFLYPPQRPGIGISACLAGQPVRYDGSDKRQPWIERLARHASLVPVCPEAGAGLGVPRPPIQRERFDGRDYLRVIASGEDVGDALRSFAEQTASELAGQLQAFIVKARSPSCGLGSTPVFAGDGQPLAIANGVFTDVLQQRWPDCLLVDEAFLASAARCDELLLRCQWLLDWQQAVSDRRRQQALACYQRYWPVTEQNWPAPLLDTRQQLPPALLYDSNPAQSSQY